MLFQVFKLLEIPRSSTNYFLRTSNWTVHHKVTMAWIFNHAYIYQLWCSLLENFMISFLRIRSHFMKYTVIKSGQKTVPRYCRLKAYLSIDAWAMILSLHLTVPLHWTLSICCPSLYIRLHCTRPLPPTCDMWLDTRYVQSCPQVILLPGYQSQS